MGSITTMAGQKMRLTDEADVVDDEGGWGRTTDTDVSAKVKADSMFKHKEGGGLVFHLGQIQ